MKTTYRRLSLAEREEISKGIYAREKLGQIAKRLDRHPSTITREIARQVKKRKWCYSALKGEKIAEENYRKRGRPKKLERNDKLLEYIQDKLRAEWSPEEIANSRSACGEEPAKCAEGRESPAYENVFYFFLGS